MWISQAHTAVRFEAEQFANERLWVAGVYLNLFTSECKQVFPRPYEFVRVHLRAACYQGGKNCPH